MKKIPQNITTKLVAKATSEQVDRFVVGAVIGNGDKVLLLKRASHDFMPGLYELPSGKVEAGENLNVSLKREVYEETGIRGIEPVDYLGSFDYQSKSGKHTRQFNFAATVDSQKVTLDSQEHEGFVWAAAHEVKNYNVSEEVQKAIQTYFFRSGADYSAIELTEQAQKDNIDRIVVGAIISKDQGKKVLVMKRASDDFMGGIDELPSGKQDGDETIEQTLSREIQEESGLDVSKIKQYIGNFDYKSGSGKNTRQLTFSVEVSDISQLKLSDEHEGFAWIQSDELDRYKISPEVRSQIKIHFDSLKPTPGETVLFADGARKRGASELNNDIDHTETKRPTT